MVEINNGSIFCACLKGGFVKTLVAFLEQPVEVLFIEASGMADPSSMKQLLGQLTVLLERRPEIRRRYEYRGSVCLIDAGRFLECCEIFQPTINQVKKSSVLILNKIDEVSEECILELHNKLNELNQGAYIYNTTFGQVPAELLEDKISPDGVLEEESCNTIRNRPVTYVLQMKGKYDLKKMKEFAMGMSERVLRFKGFFLTPEGELAHADCVGDYIRIDKPDLEDFKAIICEIVLIGKNKEDFEEDLLEKWNHCFPGQKIDHEKC
jgi:G3E family GTPase